MTTNKMTLFLTVLTITICSIANDYVVVLVACVNIGCVVYFLVARPLLKVIGVVQ